MKCKDYNLPECSYCVFRVDCWIEHYFKIMICLNVKELIKFMNNAIAIKKHRNIAFSCLDKNIIEQYNKLLLLK